MPYGTPTTDAELADYYRRTGLRPPPGYEPRDSTTGASRSQEPLCPQQEDSTPRPTTPFPLVCCLALRLVSESNQREHWATKHARVQQQRRTTYYTLRCSRWLVPALPLTITMTRIAPRPLDDDNAVASCKAVRDGIADWLAGAEGQGQDRQDGLTWQVAQQRGQAYQVLITIERTIP